MERVHLTAFGRVRRVRALAHLPSPTEDQSRTGPNELLQPLVTVALAGNLTGILHLEVLIYLGICKICSFPESRISQATTIGNFVLIFFTQNIFSSTELLLKD